MHDSHTGLTPGDTGLRPQALLGTGRRRCRAREASFSNAAVSDDWHRRYEGPTPHGSSVTHPTFLGGGGGVSRPSVEMVFKVDM